MQVWFVLLECVCVCCGLRVSRDSSGPAFSWARPAALLLGGTRGWGSTLTSCFVGGCWTGCGVKSSSFGRSIFSLIVMSWVGGWVCEEIWGEKESITIIVMLA